MVDDREEDGRAWWSDGEEMWVGVAPNNERLDAQCDYASWYQSYNDCACWTFPDDQTDCYPIGNRGYYRIRRNGSAMDEREILPRGADFGK